MGSASLWVVARKNNSILVIAYTFVSNCSRLVFEVKTERFFFSHCSWPVIDNCNNWQLITVKIAEMYDQLFRIQWVFSVYVFAYQVLCIFYVLRHISFWSFAAQMSKWPLAFLNIRTNWTLWANVPNIPEKTWLSSSFHGKAILELF